jgi:hypothetical protein
MASDRTTGASSNSLIRARYEEWAKTAPNHGGEAPDARLLLQRSNALKSLIDWLMKRRPPGRPCFDLAGDVPNLPEELRSEVIALVETDQDKILQVQTPKLDLFERELLGGNTASDGTGTPLEDFTDLVRELRYVASTRKWYNIRTRAEFTSESLNTTYQRFEVRSKESGRLQATASQRLAGAVAKGVNMCVGLVFRPNEGPIWIDEHGQRHLNRWVDPGVKPAVGSKEEIEALAAPMIYHIRYLYDEHNIDDPAEWTNSNHLLNWLAYVVQNPQKRPRWAPVHVAKATGHGRGLLFDLIVAILGEPNCRALRRKENISRGMFAETSRFVFIPEAKITGIDIINELKPLITD